MLIILTAAAFAFAGPMQREKLFEVPDFPSAVHPRMDELMAWSLKQPDQLTRLAAMSTIAEYNLTSLVDPLIAMLSDESPLIRTTAITTLAALDAKQAADKIAPFAAFRESYNEHELNAALAADLALIKWKYAPAAETWTKRLTTATTPLSLRSSAARGLGAIQHNPEALQKIVLSPQEIITLRLAAADALAQFPSPQAEAVAAAESLLTTNPLLAARLLSGGDGDQARALLIKLAQIDQPAVQAIALQRLLELDPKLIWPMSNATIASADPKVRLITIDAQKTRHEPAAIALLSAALDDPHPRNRNTARDHLRVLAADAKLDAFVRKAAADHLAVAGSEVNAEPPLHWRSAEQAALLLGELDEKSAAPALLAIMEAHPRVEVRDAAVAALRDLAVPSTFSQVHEYLVRLTQRIEANTKQAESEGNSEEEGFRLVNERMELSQVAEEAAQAMGVWRVAEADAVLRKFIPKHYAEPTSRAAAIWALGLLHENKPDKKLIDALLNRVYDLNPLDPEADEVRTQSIIAIARMKTTDAETIERLHGRYEGDESVEINAAARWAVMQLTGKPLPPIQLDVALQSDSFLIPANR